MGGIVDVIRLGISRGNPVLVESIHLLDVPEHRVCVSPLGEPRSRIIRAHLGLLVRRHARSRDTSLHILEKIVACGALEIEILRDLPVDAYLTCIEILVVAGLLVLLGGREVHVRVEDRKDSAADKGGESLEDLVAGLSSDAVESYVISPHDGGRGEEGIVKPTDRDRRHPVRVRTDLVLEKRPVEPDGVGAEIAPLRHAIVADESKRLVFRDRRTVLTGSDPEPGGEILAEVHVRTESETHSGLIALLGRVVGRRTDRVLGLIVSEVVVER